MNANFVQEKLTGSKINTFVINNDKINQLNAVNDKLDIEFNGDFDSISISIRNEIKKLNQQLKELLP